MINTRYVILSFCIGLSAWGTGLGCTEAQGAVSRYEVIRHRMEMPSPGRMKSEQSLSLDLTTIAEISRDSQVDRILFYATDGDAVVLIAEEERDAVSPELRAFRHRHELQGEVKWTKWMPRNVYVAMNSAWPDLSALPNNDSSNGVLSRTETTDEALIQKVQKAKEEASMIRASDSESGSSAEAFKWSDGVYQWTYDKSKWKPWTGYLWDFHDGKIWKGYRGPRTSGMSPSQAQGSHEPSEIQEYYNRYNHSKIAKFTAANSRIISPLDKWGVWASRRFNQTWWSAPAWEAQHHYTNVEWGGYCNGATSAAILWKKPQKSFVDQDLTFDPMDILGILQAYNFRSDNLFWGMRYNGKTGDDIADPMPHYVVDVLDQYMNKNGSPVVVDIEADEFVDNNIVTLVKLRVTGTSNPLKKKANLYFQMIPTFDDVLYPKDKPAMIPDWPDNDRMERTYKFTVTLKPDGSVESSKWEGDKKHPDFVWLPVGNRDYAPPYRRNPHLMTQFVRELVNKSY